MNEHVSDRFIAMGSFVRGYHVPPSEPVELAEAPQQRPVALAVLHLELVLRERALVDLEADDRDGEVVRSCRPSIYPSRRSTQIG